jgi:cyanophycin synthetase
MIEELRVMRGPNTWSRVHNKLVVLKIHADQYSTEQINRAKDALNTLFPGIPQEFWSDEKGEQNADLALAGLIAVTARLLQKKAVSDPGYHQLSFLGGRSAYAVFAYEEEEVGVEAAYIAEDLIMELLLGEEYAQLDNDVARLKTIYDKVYLGPSTSAIVDAARNRDIPVRKLSDGRFIILGQGKLQQRIEGSICETTSTIAVDIAGDKDATKQILADAHIPVPEGIIVSDETKLPNAVTLFGFPLVTKPYDGHQGKGISAMIMDMDALILGFRKAQEYSNSVIVEKHITGEDYRFLVVGYKFVAAAKRDPASVTGNGKLTVKELIDEVNSDPRRGEGHENSLTKIFVDSITEKILSEAGLSLDSVLPEGQKLVLKDTANISTGGTATDVTEIVHPENIELAERVAELIGLDICGIDIMAPDVETPIRKNGGAILEVNAAPGLRMHISPSYGKGRDVGKAIVDLMFEESNTGRIPVVAITGTNGKTTTSRLMAHVAGVEGYHVGFTTTDGIYLNGKQIEKGDCSGPKSTAVVLHEPSVDFAVLECARGGIVRSGLAFDKCDIGIVTNVAADHLGQKDIYTIEDMAVVKSVVPHAVKESGYAILNANDPLVLKMADELRCNIGLFALDPENPAILKHCAQGGMAATLDAQRNVVIMAGNNKVVIENVANIPVTMQGKAEFMIENVLPVALASYIMKFGVETISRALRSFSPDENQAPGRLNIFDMKGVHVMVDYFHNPHSFVAMGSLMKNISQRKTGIITGVGDRRDEDLIETGRLAAEMFDEVIIRIDKDTRGRSQDEIAKLVTEGVRRSSESKPVRVIPEAREALVQALQNAVEGEYIVMSADNAQETIEMVKEVQKEYEPK